MKALITGITGFIGSHVAERLLADGGDVLGVGRSGAWRASAPPDLVANVPLLAWDIAHQVPQAVQQKIERFSPDVIFHFAGISIPSQCGTDSPSPQAISVNVDGTRHLLDLVPTLSSAPKFIFASTVHVYARVNANAPFVTESSAIDPISAYGETKWASETEIQRLNQRGLKSCIVRGFHHIGPRQPKGLMLTDWLDQLFATNCTKIAVRSTRSHLDLIDVRDAAFAYLRLAADENAAGVYNLGSGQISVSGDVLETLLALSGRQVAVEAQSKTEQWNAIADIGKLQSLNWNPQTHYRETIASMISQRR